MAELNSLPSLLGPTEYASSGLLTNNKAYYRFESGALTTDSSGQNHTLTAISDPAEGTGKFGGGVDLDGNDAYSAVDHADLKPTGAFTVGAWVKTSTTGTTMDLFDSFSQNTNLAGFRLYITSGNTVRLLSAKNSGTTPNTDYAFVDSIQTVTDNVWHFIVATWDTAIMRIFVDGVSQATTSWSNAPVYAATNYPRIGCRNTAGTNDLFFTGSLDDVFLINGTALTVAQVSTMYGAIAYWRMEGNSNDSKGTNNGTDTAITYSGANGKFGQGAGFNGSTSKIVLATSGHTGTGSFTINSWFKTSVTGTRKEIICYGAGATNQALFLFIDTNNHVAFDLYGAVGPSSVAVVTDGVWHMGTVTNSSGTVQIYIDGIASGSTASLSPNIGNGTTYKSIGTDGGTSLITGSIDDVAIFSRALTTDEVLTLYREQSSSGFFALLGGL